MGKKEMLSVIDESGEEKIVKLITYFTLLNNECDYVAYTEYDNDDENVKVYVGRVEIDNGKIFLRTVEDDEEIDKIKDVLVGLSNNPEDGFNYILNNIDILLKTNYKIIKDIKNVFILKEIFINNIMDNYEYILNKHEEIFKYLDTNDLFVEIDEDEDISSMNNRIAEYENNIIKSINDINEILDGIGSNTDNKDKEIVDNNIDFNINGVSVEEIKLPDNNSDVNIPNVSDSPIPIDIQIKIDLNKEKIKYLNILKKEIDDEIERLLKENNEIYNK